jgi:hypothetical protein
VFIPELGRTFRCPPTFRLFGAQNPVQEGGGRKGLPRSFLNRFTRVHVELLQRQDLLFIATALHPRIPPHTLHRMADALQRLHHDANARWAAGPLRRWAGKQTLKRALGGKRRQGLLWMWRDIGGEPSSPAHARIAPLAAAACLRGQEAPGSSTCGTC